MGDGVVKGRKEERMRRLDALAELVFRKEVRFSGRVIGRRIDRADEGMRKRLGLAACGDACVECELCAGKEKIIVFGIAVGRDVCAQRSYQVEEAQLREEERTGHTAGREKR